MQRLALALAALSLAGGTAADQSIPDKYPESVLYDAPREVIPGVWSAIGATAPPTYENSGHNNNLSFVITSEGVVVFPRLQRMLSPSLPADYSNCFARYSGADGPLISASSSLLTFSYTLRPNLKNSAGVTIWSSSVEISKPPITTMASGWRISLPV